MSPGGCHWARLACSPDWTAREKAQQNLFCNQELRYKTGSQGVSFLRPSKQMQKHTHSAICTNAHKYFCKFVLCLLSHIKDTAWINTVPIAGPLFYSCLVLFYLLMFLKIRSDFSTLKIFGGWNAFETNSLTGVSCDWDRKGHWCRSESQAAPKWRKRKL